jgi:hypothetical protein
LIVGIVSYLKFIGAFWHVFSGQMERGIYQTSFALQQLFPRFVDGLKNKTRLFGRALKLDGCMFASIRRASRRNLRDFFIFTGSAVACSSSKFCIQAYLVNYPVNRHS